MILVVRQDQLTDTKCEEKKIHDNINQVVFIYTMVKIICLVLYPTNLCIQV
jgi:hypothetical protein